MLQPPSRIFLQGSRVLLVRIFMKPLQLQLLLLQLLSLLRLLLLLVLQVLLQLFEFLNSSSGVAFSAL